jgi:Acetoacetate decarboxylase (ADC)
MKSSWLPHLFLIFSFVITNKLAAEDKAMSDTESVFQFNAGSWPGTPVSSFDEQLLENSSDFQNDFYRQFRLRNAATPLRLSEGITKNYFFPTMYGDVTVSVAMFFCSLDAAKKFMPKPEMVPVDMGQGRSLVIISSYHYGKVSGIAPYNEIGISIPVLIGTKQHLPALPILLSDINQLGYYVLSMPVTTLENRIRGQKLWGLPKVVQEINLHPDGDDYVTEANDESGEKYLELRIPMNGKETDVKQRTDLYSILEGKIQRSTSKTDGKFAITKFSRTWFQKGLPPERSYLWIGDSPSGSILRQLEIEPQPFQVRFGLGVSSIFDLPHAEFEKDKFHCAFKMPITHLDDLLSCTQSDLDTLYGKSLGGAIPSGDSKGKAIFFPGSKITSLAMKATSHLWQGKVFDLREGFLLNKILRFKAIKAKVLLGDSLFDGKESIIIDYKNTSPIALPIRDEIREIGPGLYLGRAYVKTSAKAYFWMNFALDFGASKD